MLSGVDMALGGLDQYRSPPDGDAVEADIFAFA